MGNGIGFHDGWAWGGGMIGMGLIWIAVIVVLVLLVRSLWPERRDGGGDGGDGKKSALDILEERYARGEIDRQEFERKRRDLSS